MHRQERPSWLLVRALLPCHHSSSLFCHSDSSQISRPVLYWCGTHPCKALEAMHTLTSWPLLSCQASQVVPPTTASDGRFCRTTCARSNRTGQRSYAPSSIRTGRVPVNARANTMGFWAQGVPPVVVPHGQVTTSAPHAARTPSSSLTTWCLEPANTRGCSRCPGLINGGSDASQIPQTAGPLSGPAKGPLPHNKAQQVLVNPEKSIHIRSRENGDGQATCTDFAVGLCDGQLGRSLLRHCIRALLRR